MKYRLCILEEVYEDLEEAGTYYFLHSPGLEMELLDEWEHAINRISKNPLGYQLQGKRYRYGLLRRFPFLIVFELIDSQIVVFRFINMRRHPGKRNSKRKK